jgi:hypothetical protein
MIRYMSAELVALIAGIGGGLVGAAGGLAGVWLTGRYGFRLEESRAERAEDVARADHLRGAYVRFAVTAAAQFSLLFGSP